MCSSSHALRYGPVQSWAIHNFFCLIWWLYCLALVALKRLNFNEPKQWVTWSHRTGINFPFLRVKKNPRHWCFCLTTSFLTIFTCGANYIWKIRNFWLLLKYFLRKIKDFSLIKSVLWWEIWDLLRFDGWQKKQFCYKPKIIFRILLLNSHCYLTVEI